MMIFWGIAVVIIVGMAVIVVKNFRLWLQAYLTGSRVGFLALVTMPLRKVAPHRIVLCKVMAAQAGLEQFSTRAIEAQYLAGGNVERVTRALVAAHRAGIPLSWSAAAAIDLAGRDVLDAVQVSVNPIVIDCPDLSSGQSTLDGVARDGIQVKVHARVTVRTDLTRLIGGATERTIVARVGEGIISSIGACETYQEAIANPARIVRRVLEAGLDAQTSYRLVSIDIADMTVGDNIGARLETAQAEADLRVARAHSEQRRALAVARLSEMMALTRENEARVVEAESQIPTAVADAFRAGVLSVHPGNDPILLPMFRVVP